MLIKVDEDLPKAVAHLLSECGYDAATVVEQGMGGIKDPMLWNAVQSEGRFLITADKGFADIRSRPPGSHAGILLLRPDEDRVAPLIELARRVIDAYDLNELAGTVTVATPRAIRVRWP